MEGKAAALDGFLRHLEATQKGILDRLGLLEQSLLSPCDEEIGVSGGQQQNQLTSNSNYCISASEECKEESNGSIQKRLESCMIQHGVTFYQFRRVPANYYDLPFEERRDLLGAASIDHLCKSIVMVNTQAHESVKDCSDFNNSKYYVMVVQYIARLNAEKVRHFIFSLNGGKVSKKRFNIRLAPEDEAYNLTGFTHNAVTPIDMKTRIPVILSDAITRLNPPFFWLGAGEVDLKLGINTHQFIKMLNPFIADCTY